jgi:hypothetical protein
MLLLLLLLLLLFDAIAGVFFPITAEHWESAQCKK